MAVVFKNKKSNRFEVYSLLLDECYKLVQKENPKIKKPLSFIKRKPKCERVNYITDCYERVYGIKPTGKVFTFIKSKFS